MKTFGIIAGSILLIVVVYLLLVGSNRNKIDSEEKETIQVPEISKPDIQSATGTNPSNLNSDRGGPTVTQTSSSTCGAKCLPKLAIPVVGPAAYRECMSQCSGTTASSSTSTSNNCIKNCASKLAIPLIGPKLYSDCIKSC